MGDISTLFGQLAIGLETAFTLTNILFCLAGIMLGMVVGVLPGIGSLAAISMLFPITFHVEPASAIILLAGIYYGSAYGGSITSILLNVAGDASSAITCLDGNPMARQGRAGVALFMTTVASFCAACIGILVMSFFAPAIAQVALTFQAPEYFAIMVLGLIAASTIAVGSPVKGLAMVILGILFGLVGMDVYSGVTRFSFGQLSLIDGISLVAVAMGLFGVSEVISSVNSTGTPKVEKVTLRSMIPTPTDVRRSVLPILRGAGIGSFFGTLPGTGGTIASFMSYAVEKRVSREPERFGKGAIEGVVGPEASNNAADQTAFIPTLALGIPGTASMAIILGVFIIHGTSSGAWSSASGSAIYFSCSSTSP
jgi:TctA family transporter